MTEGIKYIETTDRDDFCNQLTEIIQTYEGVGYEVEVKPQMCIEYNHGQFTEGNMGAVHVYTALVIAHGTDES